MAQVIPNFVRTTLRSPLTINGAQLLLATGGGAFFSTAFLAGDWCYVTVNDSTTAEIMKYTSTGLVVSDTITVERAQDGTTAKAFPAGACVTVGWNTQQVYDFIVQTAATSVPANTTTSAADPTDPPATGVIYDINLSTGQLWYWDGGAWIAVTSNRVAMLTVAPAGAPPTGTTWTINTTDASLWFWTGASWLQVSGGASAGLVEILQRVYLPGSPPTLTADVYSFASSGLMSASSVVVDYHPNPLIPTNITIPTIGPNAYRLVFTEACLAEITVSVNGFQASTTAPARVDLLLTHTGGLTAFGYTSTGPGTSSNYNCNLVAATGPVLIPAGDAWDMNYNISGETSGPTYSSVTVNQFTVAVKIIALNP